MAVGHQAADAPVVVDHVADADHRRPRLDFILGTHQERERDRGDQLVDVLFDSRAHRRLPNGSGGRSRDHHTLRACDHATLRVGVDRGRDVDHRNDDQAAAEASPLEAVRGGETTLLEAGAADRGEPYLKFVNLREWYLVGLGVTRNGGSDHRQR